jgi:Flp pilus assembly protein TadB
MDSPETLATLGTRLLIASSVFSNVYLFFLSPFYVLCPMLPVSLDYPFLIAYQKWIIQRHWQHWAQDIERRQKKQINVRENRRGNQKWIIQRHWVYLFCLSPFYVLCPMLPVSLDYPFLIASSVFSKVYLFCLSPFYVLQDIERRQTKQINVRENRRGNQKWIIQRHWQHWAQDIERRQKKQINVRENRRVYLFFFVSVLCLVPNVASVSGLSIFDCLFCFL